MEFFGNLCLMMRVRLPPNTAQTSHSSEPCTAKAYLRITGRAGAHSQPV